MKTAIALPDSVFEAADELARRLGISRSELYATAVEEYVRAHRKERVRDTLDRVYLQESSSLDPCLEVIQALSLPGDKW
jgi:metal-responsive CopG/Arc/MetJ family transcriptional regulator